MIDTETYQHVIYAWKVKFSLDARRLLNEAQRHVENEDLDGFLSMLSDDELQDPAWDLGETLWNTGQPNNIGGTIHFNERLKELLREYGLADRVGDLGHCFAVWVCNPDRADEEGVNIPDGAPAPPVFVAIESSAADGGRTAAQVVDALSEMENKLFANLTVRAMQESGIPEWVLVEAGSNNTGVTTAHVSEQQGSLNDHFDAALSTATDTIPSEVQRLRESLASWQGNVPEEGGEPDE